MSIEFTGKYDLLRQNARDLTRKGLINDYSLGNTATHHLWAQAQNEIRQGTNSYRCRECGIEIASKELMKEHIKTHFKGEERENEIDIMRVSPY